MVHVFGYNSPAEVVDDVFEHILLKLEVIDLIRYKRVCKSWQCFISSSRFVNAHLNLSYNNDCKNNEFGHRRILMSISSRSLSFTYDYHNRHLIGSSNGLVCIYTCNSELIVANPTTREVEKLPQIPNIISSICWGFGYDSLNDDYKVIVGFKTSVNVTCFQVLSLQSNVWKIVGELKSRFVSRGGILCNGALHWFMHDHNNRRKVILSICLSNGEFKEIPQPDDMRYEYINNNRLGIIRGCLCIFREPCFSENKWVMTKYNVKHSWVLLQDDMEIENDVAHSLKPLKDYIPHKSSFFNDYECVYRTWEGAPIFVKSIVSPRVNGK